MSLKRSRRYDTSSPALIVYLYGKRIGTLGTSGPDVWFKYDEWVADAPDRNQWRLSVKLPVIAEPYGHEPTLIFFDNLLLESDLRREIALLTKQDSSDTTGLLGRVGGECAGAVSVWPVGAEPPAIPVYRTISRADVESIFSERHGARLSELQIESRQSMSGMQHKLVFAKVGDEYQLPINGAPSTLLLKRTSGRYDGLAINEHTCMRLFRILELPVPDTRVIDGPDGLIEVTRFDREVTNSGAILRLHQEDCCQATGRNVTSKYQKDGGPGLRDIAELLRRNSVSAGSDIRLLLRAAIANIALGNLDAHAKNFALLMGRGGLRLAPFYDIVCNEAYSSLTLELSMNFGTTRDPRCLTHADVRRVAQDLAVAPQLVSEEIEYVTTSLRAHAVEQFDDVASRVGHAPVLDRIADVVTRRIDTIESTRGTLGR